MDRISVIVPVFNGRGFIAAALQSILDQSHPADEVVVVDDGSTDGTVDVVAEFPHPVRLIKLPHQGGAPALNAGVDASQHPLLAFLDADDMWSAEKIAQQLPVLQADPGLDAVFGEIEQFVDMDLRVARPEQISGSRQRLVGISKNTMLARRTIFDRIGPFDPCVAVADFPQWYARALRAGFRTKTIDQVVAYRRVHANNTTRLQRGALHRDYLRLVRDSIQSREQR